MNSLDRYIDAIYETTTEHNNSLTFVADVISYGFLLAAYKYVTYQACVHVPTMTAGREEEWAKGLVEERQSGTGSFTTNLIEGELEA